MEIESKGSKIVLCGGGEMQGLDIGLRCFFVLIHVCEGNTWIQKQQCTQDRVS
jgi:hypothetical protein